MKLLIFAGGAGTRLWPISRKNSPKQFEPLIEGKSTLQLGMERIAEFGVDQVYIATNEKYRDLVKTQVPELPEENIMVEPAKRDLAAAVGLALVRLKEKGVSGPIAVLWADHVMQHPEAFTNALKKAAARVEAEPHQLVFLAEKPEFANQNLGWIHVGAEQNTGEFAFKDWSYKPEKEVCETMFASGEWYWNPGYFVFDIDVMLGHYRAHQPEMLLALEAMVKNPESLGEAYPKLESISFDTAIIEQVDSKDAVVMKVNLGWRDPGTLYALKEAFAPKKEDNFSEGDVVSVRSQDCFFYNEDEEKTLCAMGLEGMMVVNTKDALFICPKDDVPRMKEMLEKLEEEGKTGLL